MTNKCRIILIPLMAFSMCSFAGKIADLKYFVSSGMLAKAMAKEICSCEFIYDIGPEECLERNHVPSAAAAFQKISVNRVEKTVTILPNDSIRIQNIGFSRLLLNAKGAKARYVDIHGQRGCSLMSL